MMMVVVIVVMMVLVMIMMVMIVSVVMIAIGAADMVLMPVIEEMRIVFQRPFQVEGALVQHAGEIDAGTARLVDAGAGIDGAHHILDLRQFFRRHGVGLVVEDDIGEGVLVLGPALSLQPPRR